MWQAGAACEPDKAAEAADRPSKQPLLDCSVPHAQVAAFIWAVLIRIIPKVSTHGPLPSPHMYCCMLLRWEHTWCAMLLLIIWQGERVPVFG